MSEDKDVIKVDGLKLLAERIREDREYAWSWHCNLAMMAVDAGANPDAANRAAVSFMMRLFQVDTRPHSRLFFINTKLPKELEGGANASE